ncbi:tRNA (guanine-N(7)-)-methyltransferase (tRNA(m7G46)-methyltransferase) [Coemansia sp. RSA 2322]|nr:tRNA (guanine-N(7)-)-methyltransferase (tRNA(m7G46)-methyltransferase) [Coemansia sp. RSA 2322]
MYATLVAVLRMAVGYLVLAPLVFGAIVTTLLATNVGVSYVFQRRRERKQLGKGIRGELRLEPRVAQIPRLGFASQVAGKPQQQAYLSVFPTDYNNEKWESPRVKLGGGDEYVEVEREAAKVLELAVRDFVQDWFREVSADPSFPRCVHSQIAQAVEAVAERARTKIDVAEFVVGQILPHVTAHLRSMRLSQATEELAAGEPLPLPEENVEPHWHPALRGLRMQAEEDEELAKRQEKTLVMAHIRRMVDLITPLILPPEQSTFAAHRVLVRELLTGALLAPLVLSLGEPDTINQLLDSQLERLIREQHMVNELREALYKQARGMEDEGDGGDDEEMDDDIGAAAAMAASEEGELAAAWAETPQQLGRTYEQFMSTIDECSDAAEVERIRSDILAEIRKRRILIMGQSKDDIVHGQRVGDIIVYVNRLYVAKKKAERRLEALRQGDVRAAQAAGAGQRRRGSSASSAVSPFSGARATAPGFPSISRASTYYEHRDDPAQLGPPQFTLHEILTNVSSLSAFAEYMDLIGQRLTLEFWVNVEGVRQVEAPGPVLASAVASLWKSYFTVRVDELAALGSDVEAAVSRVQRCLKPFRAQEEPLSLDTDKISDEVCAEAFGLIGLAQRAVFRHMEAAEFPPFLRSALYSRFLKEYYVTSRQDQIQSALFSGAGRRPQQTEAYVSLPVTPAAARPSRRASLVRSARSVSGESTVSAPQPLTAPTASQPPAASSTSPLRGPWLRTAAAARAWTFGRQGARTEAPLVSTDRSEAVGTLAGSEPVAASLGEEPNAAASPNVEPRRRSVRVGRSEVRRLSASLRTIGLGEGAEEESGEGAEEDEDELTGLERISSDDDGSEDGDSSSVDEAESLVIARSITTPVPGDLFADERAAAVGRAVGRITHQMAIVRALLRQAQKTRHRAHEQRVLRAAYGGLRREALAAGEQQRAYGAAGDAMRAAELSGHVPRAHADAHVTYLIELQLAARGAAPAAGWVVARRYREFFALHRDLRAALPAAMRAHELPARTPLQRLQRDRDVDARRRALEAYLQALLRDPHVRGARALRLFLSAAAPPGADAYAGAGGAGTWMQRICKTVGDDIGGVTGAGSMLELIVQELGAQVALQQPPAAAAAAGAESAAFVDPLSDLFVEVFGLKHRRNWLRRQAISILLRHIVGGAVERRIRDAAALQAAPLAAALAALRHALWPGGARLQAPAPRTAEQAADTQQRARGRVMWYVPRVLGGMVGRKNARDGAARLLAGVQQRRPNLSLALTCVDAVLAAVFPEIKLHIDEL